MRIRTGLFCLLTAASISIAADISKNPSVSLGSEKLFLANVEGSGSEVLLNEYIRKGETLDTWTVLFAVRRVQTTNGVNDVVGRWKGYLSQVNSPGLKLKEEEGSTANDRRFVLAIRPPGDAYLESNVLRFVPTTDGKGVIYYQAAVRVNPKNESEVNKGLVRQTELAEALKSVSVTPVEKMPEHTTGAPPPKK